MEETFTTIKQDYDLMYLSKTKPFAIPSYGVLTNIDAQSISNITTIYDVLKIGYLR